MQTYIQLAPGVSFDAVNKSVTGFIHSKDEKITTEPTILAMNDWHLRNNFVNGKQSGGRIEFVRLFGIIAWIIIVIACIAIIIAIPIAFYFMDRWLQNFSYRIHIGWGVFVLAGISAILIALFTVSFQAIRAALVNPVRSLRSE